jgi:hypothetical protein
LIRQRIKEKSKTFLIAVEAGGQMVAKTNYLLGWKSDSTNDILDILHIT